MKGSKFFWISIIILLFTFIIFNCSNGSTDSQSVKTWYEGIWNKEDGKTQMNITGTSFVQSYNGEDIIKGTITFNESAGTFHISENQVYSASVWVKVDQFTDGNYTRITEDQMKFEGPSLSTAYVGTWTKQ